MDYGTNFVCKQIKELYNFLWVKAIKTNPSHPATKGMVERFNITLKVLVRKVLKQWRGIWDHALSQFLGEYRRFPTKRLVLLHRICYLGDRSLAHRTHCDTDDGQGDNTKGSRKEFHYTLTEIGDDQRRWRDRKVRYKEQFDKKVKEQCFEAGNLVMVWTPGLRPKQDSKWNGPFMVENRTRVTTYEVSMSNRPRKWLKKTHLPALRNTLPQ